jgi:hypothetical protein
MCHMITKACKIYNIMRIHDLIFFYCNIKYNIHGSNINFFKNKDLNDKCRLTFKREKKKQWKIE